MVKRLRNLPAGGNVERTQVAVEYNGLVVRTRGWGEGDRCKISIAVLLSLAHCVTLKNHSGSSKIGDVLRYLLRAFEKDSKVEILF